MDFDSFAWSSKSWNSSVSMLPTWKRLPLAELIYRRWLGVCPKSIELTASPSCEMNYDKTWALLSVPAVWLMRLGMDRPVSMPIPLSSEPLSSMVTPLFMASACSKSLIAASDWEPLPSPSTLMAALQEGTDADASSTEIAEALLAVWTCSCGEILSWFSFD